MTFAGLVLIAFGITTVVASGATSRAAAAATPAGKDPPFSISGSVSGLAPGVGSQLPLTISNPFNFPIRVTTLTVAVGDAGGACPGRNLQVQPFRGSLPVPARGRATALLPVVLLNSSPDVCEAVTWPLTYGGQAVKASSSGGGGGGSPSGSFGTAGSPSSVSGDTAAAPSGDGSVGSDNGTTSAPSQGGLAFTGLMLWILVAGAAVLILSGAAILLAQRRRRHSAAGRALVDESWAR